MTERTPSINRNVLIAISGSLFLVIMYANALINPLKNVEFIYKVPIVMWVLEFINIHSLTLFYRHPDETDENIKDNRKMSLGFFAFYLFFYLGVLSVFRAYTASLLALISLFTKFFIRYESTRSKKVGFSAAILLGSLFFAILSANYWQKIFQFPDEFSDLYKNTALNSEGAGGFFTDDIPQTGLIWGITYFGCSLIMELLFLKPKNHLVKRSKTLQVLLK